MAQPPPLWVVRLAKDLLTGWGLWSGIYSLYLASIQPNAGMASVVYVIVLMYFVVPFVWIWASTHFVLNMSALRPKKISVLLLTIAVSLDVPLVCFCFWDQPLVLIPGFGLSIYDWYRCFKLHGELRRR